MDHARSTGQTRACRAVDRMGTSSKRWKDNLPGDMWVRTFVERNGLTKRMVTHSRKRTAVDQRTIEAYFAELAVSLADVPPANLINYDETGLTDDPGKRRYIVRQGSHYPETVANNSKVTTNEMFAGTASGHLLPPHNGPKARSGPPKTAGAIFFF